VSACASLPNGPTFGRVNDVAGFIRHPHLRRIEVETPSGPVSYPAPAPIRDEPRAYGRIPALGDRHITVEVRLIAAKGEYTSWRATRATGDFDLRTFSIRAYPVDKVPELRPGMSAYMDHRARR